MRIKYENCLKMKKIVFVAIAVFALCLGGCKDKKVTTQYTIGCLGYQLGTDSESELLELQEYFQSNVEYNKIVSFEGISLAENDAQAREFFDEQMAKINTEYVCTLLSGSDFFIYGIATLNAGGDYRYIKAIKFQENGAFEVSE